MHRFRHDKGGFDRVSKRVIEPKMIAAKDGPWVYYADMLPIKEKCQKQEEKIVALRKELRRHKNHMQSILNALYSFLYPKDAKEEEDGTKEV